MSQSKPGILKVLGVAVSLPTAILGAYFFQKMLVQKGWIENWVGTALIVVVVAYVLYLMIKYALKQ
ncbi:MAG: hypothetical protein CME65_12325 [Halobacteriovoraceae bacterium]|nr:hypothetical protein [Halobacteriovoraceae bacterium]